MSDKGLVAIAGIIGLTIVESIALIMGIDGAILSLFVGSIGAIVGGIGGFAIAKR